MVAPNNYITLLPVTTLTSVNLGATLQRTGGTLNNWDAGAASNEKIAGDGYVEFVVRELGTLEMLGLSRTNPDNDYHSIEYAWYLFQPSPNAAQIVELGTQVFDSGPFIVGDRFRIERVGATIKYTKNGALVYTSLVPSPGSLLVDSSFYAATGFPAGSFGNVRAVSAGIPLALTWIPSGVTVTTQTAQVDANTIVLGAPNTAATVGSLAVPGKTLDALKAGSGSFKWVAAIEGYPYLLTDADPDKAVQAWGGTHSRPGALPGLFVELDNDQRIDPWVGFNGGGKCVLRVQAERVGRPGIDPDQLGVDIARRTAGAKTTLTQTADRNTTAIKVASGAGFVPGKAFIGTECIVIGSVGSSTLWTTARGKYPAFPSGGSGGAKFAEHHRVTNDANAAQLAPTVSQQPRTWIGKWVNVTLHKVDGTGLLNTRDDALCVFAGRIVGVYDDANTGYTCIELENVLDVIKNGTLGRQFFGGTVTRRVALPAGLTFAFEDVNGTTWKTANPLVTVATGAVGTNQVNAGNYSIDQLCGIVNSWLAGESAAARIYGSYTMTFENLQQGPRVVLHYYIAGTAGATGAWVLTFPSVGWAYLFGNHNIHWMAQGSVNAGHGPAALFACDEAAIQFSTIDIVSPRGVFVDQYAQLPAAIKPTTSQGLQWGVFLLNEKTLILGGLNPGSTSFGSIQYSVTSPGLQLDTFNSSVEIPFGSSGRSIRQILTLSMPFAAFWKSMMYGSGTAGYNSPTYDTQAYGLGLGIPGGILGAPFEASVDAMPGATSEIVVMIDETTKLADLIAGDMIFRHCFPFWKQGSVRLGTFITPSIAAAVATLQESNKAEPSGNRTSHRSATVETTEWQHSIVKIDHDRDITLSKGEQYRSSFTIEDPTGVDDSGSDGKPITIKLHSTPGANIAALSADFTATLPMYSRGTKKTTRSIDHRFFEQITVGDIVLVNDNFARDPATGRRKISSRPALVSHHRYNIGGPQPGNPTATNPMGGEVDLFFLDLEKLAPYVPCAQVDDTYTDAPNFWALGANAVLQAFRCYPHQHSETSEAVDASNFPAGTRIKVIQIDPDSPTSYVSWSDAVKSQSGNDIFLTNGFPSTFNGLLKYRIVFDDFANDLATQQAFSFQAAKANGLIEGLTPPFQYGLYGNSGVYTKNALTDPPELHADIAAIDGKGRDTGYERGAIRLANSVYDSKTAHQSPMLSNAIATNTAYSTGNGYQLLMVSPIFLTRETLQTSVARALILAPFFRSSDGTAVTLRVTLCQDIPTDNTKNDIVRGQPFADVSWTTSSTTWQTGADLSISFGNIKHPQLGLAWLLIEGTIKTETRGLAKCVETTRIVL